MALSGEWRNGKEGNEKVSEGKSERNQSGQETGGGVGETGIDAAEEERYATDAELSGRATEPEDEPLRPEEWQALLAAAADYSGAAPWKRLWDSPLIGVPDPAGAETGYCSVLGANGEGYGLVVFRGPEGFGAYQRMAGSSDAGPWDGRVALLTAPLLQFLRGPREHVPPEEREVYRALGHRFRGCASWPLFRSQRRGYLPWRLTSAEARFLTHALGAVTAFSHDPAGVRLLEETQDQADTGDGPQTVVLLQGQSHAPSATLGEVLPRPPFAMDASFDDRHARHLRDTAARADSTWELDLLPAPFGIGALGQRLQASWMGMAVDAATDLALHIEVYPASEALRPSTFVLAVAERVGLRPKAIRVLRREVAAGLAPLAEAWACRVSPRRRLPALEAVYDAMCQARKGS